MSADGGQQDAVVDAECSVCFEPLAEPKTLHCGHNVCARCVDRLLRQGHGDRRISCPLCRAPTDVPAGGLGTNREYAGKMRAMAERRRAEAARVERARARHARTYRHECAGCGAKLSTEQLCVCLECAGAHVCLQCMNKVHRAHNWHTACDLMARHAQHWSDYKAAHLDTVMNGERAHVAERDALYRHNVDMLQRVGERLAEFKQDANVATRTVEKGMREKIEAQEDSDYLAAERHNNAYWHNEFAEQSTDAERSVRQHGRAKEKLLMAKDKLEDIMNLLNDRVPPMTMGPAR